jgi:hypothetical protein
MTRDGSLKEVHKWLKDHDPDPDYDLPPLDTWKTYLRRYNTAIKRADSNEPRAGRGGRSIILPSQK